MEWDGVKYGQDREWGWRFGDLEGAPVDKSFRCRSETGTDREVSCSIGSKWVGNGDRSNFSTRYLWQYSPTLFKFVSLSAPLSGCPSQLYSVISLSLSPLLFACLSFSHPLLPFATSLYLLV